MAKRITITVDDEVAALIQEARTIEGRPEAQMVARLVSEALYERAAEGTAKRAAKTERTR